MICTNSVFEKENHKKKFIYIILFAMFLGCIFGSLLAYLHCSRANISMPSFSRMILYVARRDVKRILLTDALFSLFILICSFFGRRKIINIVLFLLKGFFVSYFCYIFIFFYQAHGLIFALCVLLLHSILLLPLQMVTAFTLSFLDDGVVLKKRFCSFLALNMAAVLICSILDSTFIPDLLLHL